ncbi:MAG: acyl-CoA desaturase [Planctomycetota bacterium]
MTTPTSPTTRSAGQRLLAGVNAGAFAAVHLACFAAIWTGVSWPSIGLCIGLYYLRMFGVTAGYHRYFSHRTFQLDRLSQFLLAFLAQTSGQKGVLWWAAHHRHHHRHSDQDTDLHSPKQQGLWHAHVGWILSGEHEDTDQERVKDLAKYPELRFLNRFHQLPSIMLGLAVWHWLGTEALVVGFVWSTVLCWHGTFCINSLTHVIGRRAYDTTDESRNSLILALVCCGEGWHNNHHYYQSCARQGFRWWQIDPTYYVLWCASKVGWVRKLKQPPRNVIEAGSTTSLPLPQEPTPITATSAA